MTADLFDEIAKSVPETHLPEYWRVMAHFRKLRPDDEILHIFQGMGVLTLILRQLPEALTQERMARQEQLDRFRAEMTRLAENTSQHVQKINQHSDALSNNLENNATLFCTSANLLEKASKQAIEDIDIEKMVERLTSKIEEKIRFTLLSDQLDKSCKQLEAVSQNAHLTINALKSVHFWPALGAVSGGILCLSLCLVALGLRQIQEADAIVLNEKVAQIQSMAEANKETFAELARNQIKVDVVGVTSNGQRLYSQEALRLTPALDTKTAEGSPKSGLIYFPTLQNNEVN